MEYSAGLTSRTWRAKTLAFNNISGIGRSGTGVLKVDGAEVARQTMERTQNAPGAPRLFEYAGNILR